MPGETQQDLHYQIQLQRMEEPSEGPWLGLGPQMLELQA